MRRLRAALRTELRRLGCTRDVRVCWATDADISDAMGGGAFWAAWWRLDGVDWVAVSDRLRCAPLYVLRYLVAHELLHIELPPRGRCQHHRAFRIAERVHPDYARACRWLEDATPAS